MPVPITEEELDAFLSQSREHWEMGSMDQPQVGPPPTLVGPPSTLVGPPPTLGGSSQDGPGDPRRIIRERLQQAAGQGPEVSTTGPQGVAVPSALPQGLGGGAPAGPSVTPSPPYAGLPQHIPGPDRQTLQGYARPDVLRSLDVEAGAGQYFPIDEGTKATAIRASLRQKAEIEEKGKAEKSEAAKGIFGSELARAAFEKRAREATVDELQKLQVEDHFHRVFGKWSPPGEVRRREQRRDQLSEILSSKVETERGFVETFAEAWRKKIFVPYVGDALEIKQVADIYNAMLAIDTGAARPEDYGVILDFDRELRRDRDNWAKVAELLVRMPAFAGEIASTGGLYTVGKKIGKKAAIAAVEKALTRVIRNKFGAQLATRVVGEVSGAVLGTVFRMPVASPLRVAARTIKGLTGKELDLEEGDEGLFKLMISEQGDGFLESLYDAAGGEAIELLTEMSGPGLKFVSRLIPGAKAAAAGIRGAKAAAAKILILKSAILAKVLAKRPKTRISDLFDQIRSRSAWDGPISEIGEEELGKLLRRLAFIDDQYEFSSVEDLYIQYFAFLVPGTGRALAEGGFAAGRRQKAVEEFAEAKGMQPEQVEQLIFDAEQARVEADAAGGPGPEAAEGEMQPAPEAAPAAEAEAEPEDLEGEMQPAPEAEPAVEPVAATAEAPSPAVDEDRLIDDVDQMTEEEAFDRQQEIMRILPNDIGRLRREGKKLSSRNQLLYDELQELEKKFPSTSQAQRDLFDKRKKESSEKFAAESAVRREDTEKKLADAGLKVGDKVRGQTSALGGILGTPVHRGIVKIGKSGLPYVASGGKQLGLWNNQWTKEDESPSPETAKKKPVRKAKEASPVLELLMNGVTYDKDRNRVSIQQNQDGTYHVEIIRGGNRERLSDRNHNTIEQAEAEGIWHVTPSAKAEEAAKEPWQMTKEEYAASEVARAISEGVNVADINEAGQEDVWGQMWDTAVNAAPKEAVFPLHVLESMNDAMRERVIGVNEGASQAWEARRLAEPGKKLTKRELRKPIADAAAAVLAKNLDLKLIQRLSGKHDYDRDSSDAADEAIATAATKLDIDIETEDAPGYLSERAWTAFRNYTIRKARILRQDTAQAKRRDERAAADQAAAAAARAKTAAAKPVTIDGLGIRQVEQAGAQGAGWVVEGKTRENRVMLKEIQEGTGVYVRNPSRWWYKNDPTDEIRNRLSSERAGEEPGASEVSNEDVARDRARQQEDRKSDDRGTGEIYRAKVGEETQSLIRKGEGFDIPEDVIAGQIEDVGAIVNAYDGGKPLFIVGTAPGMGKTFVLGGVIREISKRDNAPRIIYVTQNQELIGQVRKDLKEYGVTDVEFVTYAVIRKKPPDAQGAVVLFDEAHTAKNLHKRTGQAAEEMAKKAKFSVYASATPFENVTEAAYLEASGLFEGIEAVKPAASGVPETTLSGFAAWAWMFGASVQRRGKGALAVYWGKGKSEAAAQILANEWLEKRGVYVHRPMVLPPEKVLSNWRAVKVSDEYVKLYEQVDKAYAAAEAAAGGVPGLAAQVKAHGVNLRMRLLEAAKAEDGIKRAKELIDAGKQVIVFVNYKADRVIGEFARADAFLAKNGITGSDKKQRFTSQQVVEMNKAHLERTGNRTGLPFSRVVEVVAEAMQAQQLHHELVSVVELFKRSFPGKVAEYTGAIKDAAANRQLAAWKKGELQLIVATMSKGGTGLSYHDPTGTMPDRVQLNINLPWSSTKVEQVSGRLARLGIKKPVSLEWIFASNIPFEQQLSERVGAKMVSMSAVVGGRESEAGKKVLEFDFATEVPEATSEEASGKAAKTAARARAPEEADTTAGAAAAEPAGAPSAKKQKPRHRRPAPPKEFNKNAVEAALIDSDPGQLLVDQELSAAPEGSLLASGMDVFTFAKEIPKEVTDHADYNKVRHIFRIAKPAVGRGSSTPLGEDAIYEHGLEAYYKYAVQVARGRDATLLEIVKQALGNPSEDPTVRFMAHLYDTSIGEPSAPLELQDVHKAEDLNVGDTFRIHQEPFTVKGRPGEKTIASDDASALAAVEFHIGAGALERIPIDRGSLNRAETVERAEPAARVETDLMGRPLATKGVQGSLRTEGLATKAETVRSVPETADGKTIVFIEDFALTKQDYATASPFIGDEVKGGSLLEAAIVLGVRDAKNGVSEPRPRLDLGLRDPLSDAQFGGMKKAFQAYRRQNPGSAPQAADEDQATLEMFSGVPLFSMPDTGGRKPEDDKIVLPEGVESVASESPEVEERIRKAKGIRANTGILEGVKASVKRVIQGFRRRFIELDPTESVTLATSADILRQYNSAPAWARAAAYDRLAQITEGLGQEKVLLLARVLILPDILKDIEDGLYAEKELPFGYADAAAVQRDLATWESIVEQNPDIKEALAKRARIARGITERLVELDLLPAKALKDPRYYHRQVMEYMAAGDFHGVGVAPSDVRPHRKGWQIKRIGGGDFNTQYEEAEYEWLASAFGAIATKEVLDRLDQVANIQPQLDAQAKYENKVAASGGIENWERIGRLRNEVRDLATGADRGESDVRALISAKLEELDRIDPLRPFRLRKMAAKAMLIKKAWEGAYSDAPRHLQRVVEGLAEEGRAQSEGGEAEDSDRDVEDGYSTSEFWEFVNWAAQQENEGSGPARGLFIAITKEKEYIKEALGNRYVTWREKARATEGYAEWQPQEGVVWFRSFTLEEKVLDKVLKGERELADSVKQMLVMGGAKQTWVIPTGLAKTLDEFRPLHDDAGVGGLWITLQASWKQWVLLNPLRAIRYNLNNLSGDLDIALAYSWEMLAEFKQAGKDLWAYHRKGEIPDSTRIEIEDALKRGVIDSGLSLTEIQDIHEAGALAGLVADNSSKIARGVNAYWRNVRDFTTWRENILRLAAYRYFKKVNTDGKLRYAASDRKQIDALRKHRDDNAEDNPPMARDLNDAVNARLARDLIGDYGNVSHSGRWIRRHLIPFYSWIEINAPRYYRLLKNLPHEGTGGTQTAAAGRMAGSAAVRLGLKAGIFGLKIHILYVLMQTWNATVGQLFLDDDEEEAVRRMTRQRRLIVGRDRDGNVISIRAEGAFADALRWFALEDYPQDIADIVRGEWSVQEKMADAINAPVERIVQSWEPVSKTVFELVGGRSSYPRVFQEGRLFKTSGVPIRDKLEYTARLFSADGLYRQVTRGAEAAGVGTGKPLRRSERDVLGNLLNAIVYRTDPGEAAYWETKQKVRRWSRKRLGKDPGGFVPNERSNALYYYRRAIAWGDEKAASSWLVKYGKLGGTAKGLRRSVRLSSPFGGLSDTQRRAFIRSLNEDEIKLARVAARWYKRPASEK